jgi:lipopolysaccharide export system permease protein
MRAPRTLSLYMARETLLYGGLGFIAITTVMVSQNLLRRLDDLVVVGFTFADFLVVLRCLVPMLMAYAMPISLLFGALLATRRMASDSEILAMRACGVGLRALVAPTVLLGVLVSGISAYLMVVVEHQVRRDLLSLFKVVAARGSLLQAGEFGVVGRSIVFVDKRDRDNNLKGVMISDRGSDKYPFFLFAETGQLRFEGETETIRLRLERGEIHLEPKTEEEDVYHRIFFDSIDYTLDVSSLLRGGAAPERPKQMELYELRAVVARGRAGEELLELHDKDPIAYELEIHRRFALPVAPLLFSLAAVPLGLLRGRSSRAWGLLLGLITAFGYYALMTFSQFLAKQQLLAPVASLWLPNLLFAGLAVHMIARARNRFDP